MRSFLSIPGFVAVLALLGLGCGNDQKSEALPQAAPLEVLGQGISDNVTALARQNFFQPTAGNLVDLYGTPHTFSLTPTDFASDCLTITGSVLTDDDNDTIPNFAKLDFDACEFSDPATETTLSITGSQTIEDTDDTADYSWSIIKEDFITQLKGPQGTFLVSENSTIATHTYKENIYIEHKSTLNYTHTRAEEILQYGAALSSAGYFYTADGIGTVGGEGAITLASGDLVGIRYYTLGALTLGTPGTVQGSLAFECPEDLDSSEKPDTTTLYHLNLSEAGINIMVPPETNTSDR